MLPGVGGSELTLVTDFSSNCLAMSGRWTNGPSNASFRTFKVGGLVLDGPPTTKP